MNAFSKNHIIPAIGWQAQLQLGFSHRQGRSILSHRQHHGPLVVQKTLHPEGDAVCHAIILHPPGGVAGGDQLALKVHVDSQAHVLLTTPGAGKWYKSNGAFASQQNEMVVASGGILEWLPQETILYNAAQINWLHNVQLTDNAVYAGWEILCLGRQACGETFAQGQLLQRQQIYRDQRLIWNESANLRGSDPLLDSVVGLAGYPVCATFVISAGNIPPDLLQNCRGMMVTDGARAAVTTLPDLFIARYLGHNAIQARQYFEQLRQILRPWYAGREAQAVRIWAT